MSIQSIFIPDKGTTVEQINENLSALLALAPNVHRQIIKIERDPEGKKGFWLHYTTNP